MIIDTYRIPRNNTPIASWTIATRRSIEALMADGATPGSFDAASPIAPAVNIVAVASTPTKIRR